MLSGIITIALMLLFVAIWIWAWRPRHKQAFDATARLALDTTLHPATAKSRQRH